MGRSALSTIVIAALGCGPSVIVEGDTDAATSAASRDDDGGDDGASHEGGGPGPSTRGDTTAGDGGPGGDDPMPPIFDVPPATTGDVCMEWASMGCALDVPPASLVHGSTPLGELPMGPGYAFVAGAPFCDVCVEAVRMGSIFIVADPSDIEPVGPGDAPWPGLELLLDAFEGPLGEEITVPAVVRTESEEAVGVALIRIDALPEPQDVAEPFDASAPVYLAGEVVGIQGDGWSVHGPFVAAYCPQLNQIAICE